MTVPDRRNLLGVEAPVGARPSVAARDGLLLLFGAVALAVLALASGSMVRLLGRMEGRLGAR